MESTENKLDDYVIPDGTKIFIVTPNYTNLFSSETHSNHVECVSQWSKWGLDYSWAIIGRTFVHFARTNGCKAAIDGGFTHIFWLDDDAIISPELLPRFISFDKDVVICPYPMRRSPFEIGVLSSTSFQCRACDHYFTTDGIWVTEDVACPVCASRDVWRDFHNHKTYHNMTTRDLDRGLVEVDGGGTHAMLVKVEALTKARGFAPPKPGEPLEKDNISYPPEMIRVYNTLCANLGDKDRDTLNHYIGDLPDQSMTFEEENADGKPFFIMPKTGTEDMYWCYRAKCKGIGIYCDTDSFADHVSFPPVITRRFTEQAERAISHGIRPEELNLTRVDGDHGGRDHTRIRVDKAANLV